MEADKDTKYIVEGVFDMKNGKELGFLSHRGFRNEMENFRRSLMNEIASGSVFITMGESMIRVEDIVTAHFKIHRMGG